MNDNGLTCDLFDRIRALSCAETWSLSSDKVQLRPSRMEAIFYASEGYSALQAMLQSGFEIDLISNYAKVIWHGIQTRVFVRDDKYGIPYINTSNMMEARPKPSLFLSKKATKNLKKFIVYKGTILLSMSGSVGNLRLVDEDLDDWTATVDALRVDTIDSNDLGPVYCYLQSSLGQFLLQRSQTGSVVRHIYEADVSNLPIPRLPRRLRGELTKRIQEVSNLRVEVNRLLNETEWMIQQQLELPDIEFFKASRKTPLNHNAITFAVRATDRIIGSNQFGRCRFDATHHDPAAVKLRDYLQENKQAKKLLDISTKIWRSNLRQRVYVDEKSYGVPLLTGKHISLIRFNNLNYLSKSYTKKINHEMVNQGYVLVTCGGTIGKIMFVHRNMDGYAVSEDVLRVIPNVEHVYAGFVYAFLCSPYGQIQLTHEEYGSVQKKLRDFQVGDILIPIPKDKGLSINQLIITAFNKRADALEKENAAFDLFMTAIREGREATEARWGSAE